MLADLAVRSEATELQVKKLRRWFQSMDADGDGAIDVLDFTGMAQLYCEAYDVAPRSQTWRRMHAAAHATWRSIERRTGALDPTVLTLAEWVGWWGTSEYADFIELAAIPFSTTAFSIADSDGDGRCTVDEMMAAQHRSGMSLDEVHGSFDVLDHDGDGYITTAEFVVALREFYFSDDPAAPGNFLAGDL
jgi:Ca2+-binding EF-hand superfamily protein